MHFGKYARAYLKTGFNTLKRSIKGNTIQKKQNSMTQERGRNDEFTRKRNTGNA